MLTPVEPTQLQFRTSTNYTLTTHQPTQQTHTPSPAKTRTCERQNQKSGKLGNNDCIRTYLHVSTRQYRGVSWSALRPHTPRHTLRRRGCPSLLSRESRTHQVRYWGGRGTICGYSGCRGRLRTARLCYCRAPDHTGLCVYIYRFVCI